MLLSKNERLFFLLFIVSSVAVNGQAIKKRFPIWYSPSKHTNSYGIVPGPFIQEQSHQQIHGIYVELLGQGLVALLLPGNPLENIRNTSTEPLNKITGVSLSLTGTMNPEAGLYGLAVNPIGSYYKRANGLNISGYVGLVSKFNGVNIAFFNLCQEGNGMQIGLSNEASYSKGIQLGVFNRSKNLRGVQIGIWNINQKRKFPLINWNFKRAY